MSKENSDPYSVKLDTGEPLYYALLPDPDPLYIKAYDAHEAKSLLYALIRTKPEDVLKCQGKTREEVRKALLSNQQ